MRKLFWLVVVAVLGVAACDGPEAEAPGTLTAALRASAASRGGDRAARQVLLANRTLEAPAVGASAPAMSRATGPGLFVVHFAGPIQGAWRRGLEDAGLVVLDYVPANAYVVWADGPSLTRVAASTGAVDLIAPFEDADKRSPMLVMPASATEAVDVTFVVADHAGVRDTLAAIDAATLEVRTHDRRHRRLHVLGRRVAASALDGLVARADVYWVEPWLEPLLHDEVQDQILAGAHDGVAPTGPGYRAWLDALGITGLADVVVDVSDTGIDTGVLTGAHHADLEGRFAFCNNFVTGEGSCDDRSGHGTINAAIVAGDATNGTGTRDPGGYLYGEGVAPGARFGASAIFSNGGSWGAGSQSGSDFIKAAWQAGARISTNSWGSHAYGAYTTTAQEYDALVRDADLDASNGNQPMAVFFSAGNDGSGSYSIGAPATGKNVISVGASENYRLNGTDGCGITDAGADDLNDVIAFSSRGPTKDGRLKPDVVAPGTHVQGAASTLGGYSGSTVCDKYWPGGQATYARSSGTSHSCPAAAGVGALLYAWVDAQEGQPPSPALLKAMLVAHTADMSGGENGKGGALAHRPDPDQGYGRIDLSSAFAPALHRVIVDQTTRLMETGDEFALTPLRAVDPSLPVLVVLAWTDAPGATTGAAYNNDLDLEVSTSQATWLGNVFVDGWSATGGDADRRNNVEAVFLPAWTVSSFALRVRAANLPSDGVPGNGELTDQDFAIYVANATTQSPTGSVTFDSVAYACTSVAVVTVSDQDLQGAGTVQATVSSPLEPAGEVLTLTEVPPATGVFTASLPLAPTPTAPGDGRLQVADGDELTALYLDADDGTGHEAEARAGAVLDCRPPLVYGVWLERGVEDVRVSWRTDEPATSGVVYAFGTGPDLTMSDGALVTDHSLTIGPLPDCKDLRVRITAADRFGTTGGDDNEGQRYHLGTGQRDVALSATFDTNPGWQTTGSWAFGAPKGGCGDPVTARTGAFVYGTNLSGCYGSNAIETLTTPAFWLPATPTLALAYARWLRVETGWDFAEVQVTEGSQWITLWASKTHGELKDTSWVSEQIDLGAWAGKQVRLRWSLATDSNTTFGGWNVDDVSVVGRTSCPGENKVPTCTVTAAPKVGDRPFTTMLDASGSVDPDGSIWRTRWDFDDGTVGEGPIVTHEYVTRGTYVARVTVIDNAGGVGTCTVQVKANEPPRACFVADAELIQKGDTVRFDAGCSADVDGGVSHYAWAFGDGSTATTAAPLHVYSQAGVYTVTLSVTDTDGAEVAAVPQVITVNAPPTADVSWFPVVPQVNEIVRFDAGGSLDPDGQVKNWTWAFGDGIGEEDTGTPLHAYGDPGNYRVSLEIIDNWGGHATVGRDLRVNAPPRATFTASPSGPVWQGAEVDFDASESRDLDGALAALSWDFGDGEAGEGELVPHVFPCPGSFEVRLDAVDDDGASDRAERLVQVKNLPPQVTLPDHLEAVEGSPLLLDADVVEICPESPLTWLWKTGDGDFATTPFVSHAWADDGAYGVEVCVRDPQNASGCDTVTVAVANAEPVVEAGADRTVAQGEALVFGGAFSDKGSLDTHTVAWDFGDGGAATGSLSPTHTYVAVGDHTARLVVTDDDAGVGTDTLVVHVVNASPRVDAGPDRSAKEGQQLVLSASAIDPGGDALDVQWDFGDGETAAGSGPHAHTWVDNGQYALTVRATDPHGGVGLDTAWIAVANVAPTAEAGAALMGVEGDVLRFEGLAVDASPVDTLVWAWHFGDGIQAATRVAQHAFADDGVYTATFVATDDDGGVGSDSREVTISNAPPKVAIGGDATVDEGGPARFWSQASDPGAADVLTLGWSFGDGAAAQGATQVEHVYRDDGDFPVTFTATDDDGASASDSLLVQVRNVAPRVEAGPDRVVREGEPVTLAGSFTDPGPDDTHLVQWAFGDASSSEGPVAPVHAWACAGTFQATLTVTDDDGGVGSDAATVTVTPIAPTLDAGLDRAVVEGAEVAFTAQVSDPCPAGVPDATGALWDFGDGATAAGTLTPSHRFVDNGTFPVTVRLVDPSGGDVTDVVVVTVSNAAPVVEAGSDVDADEGSTVAFEGSFTDAGPSDQHVATWHFGDGSSAATAVASHAYADEGAYTATLAVTDDDGGVGSDVRTIHVHNVAPHVDAGADLAAVEGTPVTLVGAVSDPGAHDVVTARWDFGDGVTAAGAIAAHAWLDDGAYLVRLTASDDDGASADDTLVVQVANLPPVVDAGPDRLVVQGEPVLLAGTAKDPGPLDVLELRWSFGDGGAAAGLDAPVHAWSTPGAFVVTLTARDDDGAEASDTAHVTVTNAPPVVSLAPVAPAREGTPVTLVAAADDAGGEPPVLAWTFGDGGVEAGPASVSHAFADDGTYTACVQATDSQGASARACVDVLVANAPPVISSAPVVTVEQASPWSYDIVAEDAAGAFDPLTYALEARPAGMTVDLLSGHVAWTPTGADVCDVHPVLVRVQDDDGGRAWQSFELRVTNLDDAPVITSVAPSGATQGYLWTYAPSASDGDVDAGCVGDELTWSLLDGPAGAEVDPATGAVSWTPGNVDVGTQTLRLSVVDTTGLADVQEIAVAVQADPRAPVALAGLDREVDAGVVRLDGSASWPAGTLATWEWTQLAGPIDADPEGCAEAVCPVTLLARGVYTFRLVVTDLSGRASPPDDVTIAVRNVAPVADGGLARVVSLGTAVVVDAAGSTDLNGDPLTAAWQLVTAPAGSTAALVPATGLGATLTPDRVGAYALAVSVFDGEAWSEPAQVGVMGVNALAPDYPPVAMIVPSEIVVPLGEPVTLDGGASHDPEATALTYAWQALASPAPLTLDPADGPTVTFTPTAPGLIRVGLVVTSKGAGSWRAEALVVVRGEAPLPVADAGADQVAPVGTVVTLDGTASAVDGGEPLAFSWRQVGGGALRLEDPTAPTPGTRVFRAGRADVDLVVSTADGRVSRPDRVSVYRVTGANRPPVPAASAPGLAWAWDEVVLDGSATADPDADALAYAWVQTAGPAALLADWRAPVTTFLPPEWGEVRFELVVTDGDVQAAPAEVRVRVASPNNRPPEADAGPDLVGHPGETIVLDGQGSHDPEGAVLSWRWIQVDGSAVALVDATGPTPSFVAGAPGSVRFRLVVSDLLFDSAADEVQVDVVEPQPEPDAAPELAEVVEEATGPEVAPPDEVDGEPGPEPTDEVVGPEPQPEPRVEVVEASPDTREPAEVGLDVTIPLDVITVDTAEVAAEPEASGGGSSCAVGGGRSFPGAFVVAGLALAVVAWRRRRPLA